jgi:hypothetical protein
LGENDIVDNAPLNVVEAPLSSLAALGENR